MKRRKTNKTFSVIIAASRAKLLKKCLNSLFRQHVNQKKIEIIVISEKKLIKKPKDYSKKVAFVEIKHKNPAFRRNSGVKISSGKILAFIDDDAHAPKDWLETAQERFKKDPKLDCLMGPTLLPKNAGFREQISHSILTSKISGHTNFEKSKYRYEEPNLGDITLCNMLVKRKVFDQVGGFNELIGYGSEDSEFVFTAIDKYQRKMIYYSKLVVWHHRRQFGFSYLKQRFSLRKSTGKLMLVYPTRYFWNYKIGVFLTAISTFLFFLALFPKQGGLVCLLGLMILIILSKNIIKKHYLIGLIWPYALIAHFIASYLGLVCGLFSWSEIKKLRQQRRF